MEMRDPILITGAARSGTSMVAGAVHICGAWKGDTVGATRANRKGQVELRTVTNEVVKAFFRIYGWDPMGQDPLPDIEIVRGAVDKASGIRRHVHSIVNGIGQHHCNICDRQEDPYRDGPWMFKGAKLCLIWAVWHNAFPMARWVIVRRDAEDIVRSCLRTGFMRAYTNRSGWLSWVAEHEKRFEEMIDAGLDVQEVWPQRMINGDLSQIQIVINRLGLEWKPDLVREWIDPNIWSKWKTKDPAYEEE